MQKVVIPLAIIALLSASAVFFIHSQEKSVSSVSMSSIVMYDQCASMMEGARACSRITNSVAQANCFEAENKVAQLTSYGSPNLISDCVPYNNFLSSAALDEEINTDGYFQECYTSATVLEAAQSNSYYYQNLYIPVYFDCGYLDVEN